MSIRIDGRLRRRWPRPAQRFAKEGMVSDGYVVHTCSRCGDDHALPVDQCPNAWRVGRPINPQSPQLTTEQRHAFARREIELRHAAETRVMREQKQQSELAAARARAVMREYIERQRREALEAGRAAHT